MQDIVEDVTRTECGAISQEVYESDVEKMKLYFEEQEEKIELLRIARFFRKWKNAYAGYYYVQKLQILIK